MSRREKLLQKLKQSPNNVTFADVAKLLESESFRLDRVTGSHHIFKKDDIIFVLPVHQNRVKAVYLKRVIEIIEKYGRT